MGIIQSRTALIRELVSEAQATGVPLDDFLCVMTDDRYPLGKKWWAAIKEKKTHGDAEGGIVGSAMPYSTFREYLPSKTVKLLDIWEPDQIRVVYIATNYTAVLAPKEGLGRIVLRVEGGE